MLEINSIPLISSISLIEKAFGKKIRDSFLDMDMMYAFGDKQNRACYVIKEFADKKYSYLSKFCVHPDCQGVGYGQQQWQHLLSQRENFFWRFRSNSSFYTWYVSLCSVYMSIDSTWSACLYGNFISEDEQNIIRFLENKESDFIEGN